MVTKFKVALKAVHSKVGSRTDRAEANLEI